MLSTLVRISPVLQMSPALLLTFARSAMTAVGPHPGAPGAAMEAQRSTGALVATVAAAAPAQALRPAESEAEAAWSELPAPVAG